MSALSAILYREGKIRATNLTFIFWDLFYPLGYLLVFGVGMTQAMGMKPLAIGVDYNAFFLAGVLGMASFGIASNTAWSFFMDRDNGIFFEMLTYPMRRSEYLLGKGLFNLLVSIAQAVVTVVLAEIVLEVPIRWGSLPLLAAAVFIGTAGWFFFYAIFALIIRRNDVFNTVTSVFYFVLLFASSMFYPVEPLPTPLRQLSWANPITWHVDVLRYATIGIGEPALVAVEAAAFLLFTGVAFGGALLALKRQKCWKIGRLVDWQSVARAKIVDGRLSRQAASRYPRTSSIPQQSANPTICQSSMQIFRNAFAVRARRVSSASRSSAALRARGRPGAGPLSDTRDNS